MGVGDRERNRERENLPCSDPPALSRHGLWSAHATCRRYYLGLSRGVVVVRWPQIGRRIRQLLPLGRRGLEGPVVGKTTAADGIGRRGLLSIVRGPRRGGAESKACGEDPRRGVVGSQGCDGCPRRDEGVEEWVMARDPVRTRRSLHRRLLLRQAACMAGKGEAGAGSRWTDELETEMVKSQLLGSWSADRRRLPRGPSDIWEGQELSTRPRKRAVEDAGG